MSEKNSKKTPAATKVDETTPPDDASQDNLSVKRKPGILRWIFSHVVFAVIVLAAVSAYFHWNEVVARYNAWNGGEQLANSTQQGLVNSSAKTEETSGETAGVPTTGMANVGASETLMQAAWLDARRSYWAGEETAEKSYLDLIKMFPGQADITGELGNIYFTSGRKEEAAVQFLQAGRLLIKSGQKDKVANIIDLLADLDPAKAKSLNQELAAAN